MGKLFGTDGIRGFANRELTPEMALGLGRAGAYLLTKENLHKPRILLGKDTRRSGDMLEAALTAGLCSLGAEVYRAGIIPTPGIAFLVRKYKMDAGIVISASHNPMEDNGIKFFNGEGYKFPDALEEKIEALYQSDDLPRPEGMDVGISREYPEAVEDYAEFLLSTVPGLRLDGMKIALDCANGATSFLAAGIFRKLGADVCSLCDQPDGANINAGCGSTFLNKIQDFVLKKGMDIGLAFDGDGDRVLCSDEQGKAADGDFIMAICALDMQKRGLLKNNMLTATTMSNQGLEIFCRERGINLYRTDVGDRYVLERMLEANCNLGGEQSGHIIFKDYNTTGDGILTGLQLLSVMAREGKSLSVLKNIIKILPQILINVKVPGQLKYTFMENEKIKKAIEETEALLKNEGRILIRPSGTEPLVRVMMEGRDREKINNWAENLAELIKGELA